MLERLHGCLTHGVTIIDKFHGSTLLLISTSYNMAARALADLSHEGAKRPSAINQLSARAAML